MTDQPSAHAETMLTTEQARKRVGKAIYEDGHTVNETTWANWLSKGAKTAKRPHIERRYAAYAALLASRQGAPFGNEYLYPESAIVRFIAALKGTPE